MLIQKNPKLFLKHFAYRQQLKNLQVFFLFKWII